MRFHYCPDCGSKLELRQIGDEGDTPWCPQCQRPLFDQFSTCIIALVVNDREETAVLRQAYISEQYGNLVSGYMKPGETAEECAQREIEEELGLSVSSLELVRTWWMEKKELLMIGFFARVANTEMTLSGEVDTACWVPIKEALGQVHPAGSISHALVSAYLNRPDTAKT